jgi:uncharacterized cupin superfamily protein
MEPVNESAVEWSSRDHGETRFRRKQLGEAAGSEDLGCSLYELPAGARSWPYHYHTANEEAIYVLSGSGTIRLDGDEYDLEEGDYVPLMANETGGHRVINDGDETLRYLVISTMNDPDVTVYPDSEKLGVFVGAPPGSRDDRSLYGYYRIDDEVRYWEDED